MFIKKGDIEKEMTEKKTSAMAQLVAESSEEDTRIQLYIREKYSMSQESMIVRKKLNGTLTDAEWNEYNAYVEACIAKAREDQPESEA